MTVPAPVIYSFGGVLMRVSGLMLMAPVFSSAAFNIKLKLGLLVTLSFLLAAALPAPEALPETGGILLGLGGEFLIGLLIGFGYRMAMSAATTGGELIGLQMGLGAASLIDYNSGQNAALASNLFSAIFTVLFISIDGHLTVLKVLGESFSLLPAHAQLQSLPAPVEIAANTAYALSAGCRLAAPVLIPLLMLTITMGMVSRAFPQANLFSVSYGVSMLAGIVLLGLSAPLMRAAIIEMTRHADHSTLRLLRSLTGA
jgi:flagellar biosynthetic protein FliR